MNRPRPPLISYKELCTLLGVRSINFTNGPQPVFKMGSNRSAGRDTWYVKSEALKWLKERN